MKVVADRVDAETLHFYCVKKEKLDVPEGIQFRTPLLVQYGPFSIGYCKNGLFYVPPDPSSFQVNYFSEIPNLLGLIVYKGGLYAHSCYDVLKIELEWNDSKTAILSAQSESIVSFPEPIIGIFPGASDLYVLQADKINATFQTSLPNHKRSLDTWCSVIDAYEGMIIYAKGDFLAYAMLDSDSPGSKLGKPDGLEDGKVEVMKYLGSGLIGIIYKSEEESIFLVIAFDGFEVTSSLILDRLPVDLEEGNVEYFYPIWLANHCFIGFGYSDEIEVFRNFAAKPKDRRFCALTTDSENRAMIPQASDDVLEVGCAGITYVPGDKKGMALPETWIYNNATYGPSGHILVYSTDGLLTLFAVLVDEPYYDMEASLWTEVVDIPTPKTIPISRSPIAAATIAMTPLPKNPVSTAPFSVKSVPISTPVKPAPILPVVKLPPIVQTPTKREGKVPLKGNLQKWEREVLMVMENKDKALVDKMKQLASLKDIYDAKSTSYKQICTAISSLQSERQKGKEESVKALKVAQGLSLDMKELGNMIAKLAASVKELDTRSGVDLMRDRPLSVHDAKVLDDIRSKRVLLEERVKHAKVRIAYISAVYGPVEEGQAFQQVSNVFLELATVLENALPEGASIVKGNIVEVQPPPLLTRLERIPPAKLVSLHDRFQSRSAYVLDPVRPSVPSQWEKEGIVKAMNQLKLDPLPGYVDQPEVSDEEIWVDEDLSALIQFNIQTPKAKPVMGNGLGGARTGTKTPAVSIPLAAKIPASDKLPSTIAPSAIPDLKSPVVATQPSTPTKGEPSTSSAPVKGGLLASSSKGSSGNTTSKGGSMFGGNTTTSTASVSSKGGGSMFGGTSTKPTTPSKGGMFGGSSTQPSSSKGGGSMFGGSSTQPTSKGGGSIFGGSTSTQPSSSKGGGSMFGGSSTQPSSSGKGGGSVFGGTSTKPTTPSKGGMFGGSTSTQPSSSKGGGSMFGGTSTQPSSSGKGGGSIFGGNTNTQPSTPSGGSMFGGSSTQPTSKGGGSIFGGSTSTQPTSKGGGSMFGGSTNTQPSTPSGGMFGGSSTQPTSKGGGSIFGGNTNTQPTSSTTSFGSKPGSTVFGGNNAKGGGSIFGGNSPMQASSKGGGSVFGGSAFGKQTPPKPAFGKPAFGKTSFGN